MLAIVVATYGASHCLVATTIARRQEVLFEVLIKSAEDLTLANALREARKRMFLTIGDYKGLDIMVVCAAIALIALAIGYYCARKFRNAKEASML